MNERTHQAGRILKSDVLIHHEVMPGQPKAVVRGGAMGDENRIDPDRYLGEALRLMAEYGIAVRDTYLPDANLDDFLTNGRYGGPRLFKIEWSATAQLADTGPGKKYGIPGYSSIAYDAYRIAIPTRFQTAGRDDPIVHECVHFLQHQTAQEDDSYIPFDGSNYLRYVSQTSEWEAHLVQIAYILQGGGSYRGSILDAGTKAEVQKSLDAFKAKPVQGRAMAVILWCKSLGLI